jgi:hypothetical protein
MAIRAQGADGEKVMAKCGTSGNIQQIQNPAAIEAALLCKKSKISRPETIAATFRVPIIHPSFGVSGEPTLVRPCDRAISRLHS